MKKLKLIFALFAMLALGVGNAWGAEETFDWSSVTTTQQNLTSANVYTEGSVTLTFAKASGSNWPAENKEGSIRMYSNTTLTISCASGNITKVVFTSTGNTYTAANLKYNGTALSGNEWTLSSPANEVLLTASANARFKKIVVTYETASGGGETPGEGGGDPEEPTPGTGGDALSYTWDLSKKTYNSDASADKVTWSAVCAEMVVEKANAQTNANNYLGGDANNRTSTRMYKSSKLTITPATNVSVTSIVFTATSTSYATALSGSTWTNATATVSNSTVTVTPTNGTSAISATIGGTCGFTGVTVNYTQTGSGSTETVVSLLPKFIYFWCSLFAG